MARDQPGSSEWQRRGLKVKESTACLVTCLGFIVSM